MYIFYLIVQKYGWKFMDAYMQNDPQFVQGHINVTKAVSAGTAVCSLDAAASLTLMEKQMGQPQDMIIPTDDPLPVWGPAGAIFRQCKHPYAAMLFATWLLSPEEQVSPTNWSVRADLPPPPGYRPLKEYPNIADSYWQFVADKDQLEVLRTRFARIVGPIT